MKCIVIGATNVDMTLQLEGPLRLKDKNPVFVQESLGGVGYNIAHGLSTWSGDIAFLTAFEGNNQALSETFKHLKLLPVSPQPRFIGVMKDAEVEIAFSAMEALDDFSIDAFRSDIASLTKDDILCFDLNFPVTEILQLMDHTDAQIYLEATSAHKIEKLRKYNWQAAGLKLNLLEAEILTGSSDYETVLEELEQLEVKTIILTLGPEGVMVFKDRIWSHYQDQHPWKSINDSGIGDAFMAGYLAGLMRNEDPVLNAFTMSYLVAQSPQATRPDLTLKMMLKERKSHHVNVIRRRPRRP